MPTKITINKQESVIPNEEEHKNLSMEEVYQKYKGELLTLEEAKARTLARMEKWDKLK